MATTLMPDGTPSDGCTAWPDGDWEDCCRDHDVAYRSGHRGFAQRRRADLHLLTCVRKKGYPGLAVLMFLGVRGFGWLPFHQNYRRWVGAKAQQLARTEQAKQGAALGVFLLVMALATLAGAGEWTATLRRVVDGDTLAVTVDVWLDQRLDTLVRLRGIDTPEKRGKCEAERAAAVRATMRLTELVTGSRLVLSDVGTDKYGGRHLARVRVGDLDLAATLIREGHARPYDGGTKTGWCGGGS